MKYFLIKTDQHLQHLPDFRPIWTPIGSPTTAVGGALIAAPTAKTPDRFTCTLPGLGPLPKPFEVTDEEAVVYSCTAAAVLQKDKLLVTGTIDSAHTAGNREEALRMIAEAIGKIL